MMKSLMKINFTLYHNVLKLAYSDVEFQKIFPRWHPRSQSEAGEGWKGWDGEKGKGGEWGLPIHHFQLKSCTRNFIWSGARLDTEHYSAV